MISKQLLLSVGIAGVSVLAGCQKAKSPYETGAAHDSNSSFDVSNPGSDKGSGTTDHPGQVGAQASPTPVDGGELSAPEREQITKESKGETFGSAAGRIKQPKEKH